MRYLAITIITFVVLIGFNSIVSNMNLANDALDIEVRLSQENQRKTDVTLSLVTFANGPIAELLQPPVSIPQHPWVTSWPKIEGEDAVASLIALHLREFNQAFVGSSFDSQGADEAIWLDHFLELRSELQLYRIELSRYLVEQARLTFLISLVGAVALIAALLTLAFIFVFKEQRKILAKSRMQNLTLEAQRQTLLASQRAMVSISDDEQRANMRAEQLANLVEQSSEAFIRINHLGQVLHFNQAASMLFSGISTLTPESSFTSLFETERSLEIQLSINPALQENTVLTIAPGANDLEAAIEFTITRVVDSGSADAIGISILASDVSLRMHEQTQLTQIIENAPNALYVFDDKGLITVANDRAEQLFGYGPGELMVSRLTIWLAQGNENSSQRYA